MIPRTIIAWLLSTCAACYAAEPVSYNRDVLPILADHCFTCHGFDKAARQADLRLDRRDDAARVLAHQPSTPTPLLERIRTSNSEQRMPPLETGKPLTAKQIEIIEQWIHQGAPYEPHWAWSQPRVIALNSSRQHFVIDESIQNTIVAKRPELGGLSPRADRTTLLRRLKLDLTGLPPTLEEIESFTSDDRVDAYERLVDRVLASPRFGERWSRWWLDLAHYADSDGYLQDFLRPHAWRYRDWVVCAFNSDQPFDEFTIEQLGGDMLADQLEMQTPRPLTPAEQTRVRNLRVATGFLRNTLSNREGGADLEEYRVRQVVDRTTTVATTWLGLTLGCAECHDHKYDPITQTDFYRFYAIFNNADEVNIFAESPSPSDSVAIDDFYQWREQKLSAVRMELNQLLIAWEDKLLWTEQNPGADHRWDRQLEILGLIWGQGEGEGQLEGLNIIKTPRDKRTRDEQARLEEYFFQRGSPINEEKFKTLGLTALGGEIDKRRAALPKLGRAQTITTSRRIRPTHVHTRGDFRRPAAEVTPAIPTTFQTTQTNVDDRLKLARWLVASDQPLTARVTVNRLWQELFGRGLVATSENLGIRGSRPTHPQLLDHLAREFSDKGWSVKSTLRTIVLSETYQQSSTVTPAHRLYDPQNIVLSRQSRLRLSAEAIRDLALASSRLMDHAIGGASTRPPQPESVAMEGFDNKWTADTGAKRYRRGLYTFIQRTSPFAQSIIFDLPDTSRSCTRRERSNTPLQALTLLNDPVLFEAAVHAARCLLAEPCGTTESRDQELMLRLTERILGRTVMDSELKTLLGHLNEQRKHFRDQPLAARDFLQPYGATDFDKLDAAEVAAWAMTSSVLLNLDETVTRN